MLTTALGVAGQLRRCQVIMRHGAAGSEWRGADQDSGKGLMAPGKYVSQARLPINEACRSCGCLEGCQRCQLCTVQCMDTVQCACMWRCMNSCSRLSNKVLCKYVK